LEASHRRRSKMPFSPPIMTSASTNYRHLSLGVLSLLRAALRSFTHARS
jgi:hypothetical protein